MRPVPREEPARRPEDAIEATVTRHWHSATGVPPASRDQSFLTIGDSLLAVGFVTALRRELSVEFPMRAFYERPTVAGITAAIRRRLPGGTPVGPTTQHGVQ